MELQSPLSPTPDYPGPLSPSGLGPSPAHSPCRSPAAGPTQTAFSYAQLEGRFKQLQGRRAFRSRSLRPDHGL